MTRPSFIRVLHPMRSFVGRYEPLTWPSEVRQEFARQIQPSQEIWLDATSAEIDRVFALMQEARLPMPCTSLMGYASKGLLGPFDYFQLRIKQTVDLAQDADNFERQMECGWPFPPLRTGVTGCSRGGKLRVNPFRFDSKAKPPKVDIFRIAPGPRLPNAWFAVSRRALDAFEQHGLSGFVARPLLTFSGSSTDYFEVEVTATTASPLRTPNTLVSRVCASCGLNQITADTLAEKTSIGPIDIDLECADLQVCVQHQVGEDVFYEDTWNPFVSRNFVLAVESSRLTGLMKGAAGGSHEPLVTRALARAHSVREPFSD